MTLLLRMLSLGPIGTNGYVVADSETKAAAMIDPGGGVPLIMDTVEEMGVSLEAIWLTHAHFDHIGGVAELAQALNLPVALHKLDLPLYRELGGAKLFNLPFEPGPEPSLWLDTIDTLPLGRLNFEVRHVPGHSPGHVAFYERTAQVIFGGDVLFQGSIGRTDLPGGNYATLMHSIQTHCLSLPDNTIVYSGHGPATTIGEERQFNPFL